MTFVHLAVYDPNTSEFLGYVIKDDQAVKLKSTNIYPQGSEQNLATELSRLNDHVALSQHWPHPQDPEVVALLDDPSFHPIEYVEREVIDDETSHYVWIKEPVVDEFGNETGHMADGPELDREASVINYKMASVPAQPTDNMLRTKAACEQIARQRAGVLSV